MSIQIDGFPETPAEGDSFLLRGFKYNFSDKGWKKDVKSYSDDKLPLDGVAADTTKFDAKTYSEVKNDIKTTIINEISSGASSTFNTLKEIEDEIKNNQSGISGILTSISEKANASTVNDISGLIGSNELTTEALTLISSINEINSKKFNKEVLMEVLRPVLKLVIQDGVTEDDVDEMIDSLKDDIENGDI